MGARADAAQGVEAFLHAAQTRDVIGFEARIDRRALREDLRTQLITYGQVSGLEVDGGPSQRVLDRMIAPEAFQLVEAHTGQALPNAPGAAQLALMLKPIDGGRVCLPDLTAEAQCLLTFAKTDGRWRLTGMQAMALQIEVETPPAKS